MARQTTTPQNRKKKKKSSQPKISLHGSFLQYLPENIGILIFAVVLIYIVASFLLYSQSSNVNSYQVISGTLSRNEICTGLAIREEETFYASSTGYINYYAREGNKINANGAVYSLSSSKKTSGEANLSKEDMNRIRTQMSSFSVNFNPDNYNAVYGFKAQLEGSILQYASEHGTAQGNGAVIYGAQTIYKSLSDGVILYSRDGYEEKTVESLTEDDFNLNNYHEEDLKKKEQIQAGEAVYTIITNEQWELVVPITEKQLTQLATRSTIRVKFMKDGLTQSGDFEIINIGGHKYGHILFNKGMMRYASDRFLDVELVTNTETGLRIPRSAIIQQDFYIIPEDFIENDDNGNAGVMKLNSSRGKETYEFQQITIHGRRQKESPEEIEAGQMPTYEYYVDQSLFEQGELIVNPDTAATYAVATTARVDGVYCINKGYAVFCPVEIIDYNEEVAIVSEDTPYGLVQYDRIVRDGTSVKSEDILY